MGRNQRKKILIDPKFQLWFVVYSLCGAGLISCIFYVATRGIFSRLSSFGMSAGLPPDHYYFQFIQDQLSYVNHIFVLALIAVVLLMTSAAIFFSHRIAGPIYQLRLHLRKVSSTKRYHALKFREHDFFQDVPALMNECLQTELEREDDDSKARKRRELQEAP